MADSRREEIEASIDGLTPEEYRRIVQWFRVREQGRWDDQMDGDSSAGKLDFLFEEAERESANEILREWPPRKEGHRDPAVLESLLRLVSRDSKAGGQEI